ncbi:unannotated protein [freshwater metagenome]|uniref:Unannotated protein n=1 Tax=freshwater metagenome TaxID=449393 RepID=A0A6J6LGX9_9ZZZZ
MTNDPPSVEGAVQERVTAASEATAVGVAAVPGIVYGVADATADDAPSPPAFRAETRNA